MRAFVSAVMAMLADVNVAVLFEITVDLIAEFSRNAQKVARVSYGHAGYSRGQFDLHGAVSEEVASLLCVETKTKGCCSFSSTRCRPRHTDDSALEQDWDTVGF